MTDWDGARAESGADGAVLAVIVEAMGSRPRDLGAWMLVYPDRVLGTIGGGAMEFQSIAHARQLKGADTRAFHLGPGIDQCCGGYVEVEFVHLAALDSEPDWVVLPSGRRWLARPPLPVLRVHGGGHVARALARLCVDMPVTVEVIEPRAEWRHWQWPDGVDVRADASDQIPDAVLIMTHEHSQDLDWCRHYLAGAGVPWLGVIGSDSKAARFRKRLIQDGLDASVIECPVGQRLGDKSPPVVALSLLHAMMPKLLSQLPTSRIQ
ncbi:xanthine dehydrogenase accessory protein XdhC [Litorivicinus lipolyticus]|uniref:Xanthine dehydrogenase accessory protein XdhC n=1 Tax=Litorivicinus lipolyticus TaxID=418701 RepID=A0A5Q2QGL8_9GAMM|nr:xanthine dehydrogenase accessory protein XdhC [Litorivicinus lipolyticus]QGG81137.1 xanthine dehydrogenase accessory protein XdhC [Litorivicinus lipolyticus]